MELDIIFDKHLAILEDIIANACNLLQRYN